MTVSRLLKRGASNILLFDITWWSGCSWKVHLICLHAEDPTFSLWYLQSGLGKTPIWTPGEPLWVSVDNTDRDGPMVFLSIRPYDMFLFPNEPGPAKRSSSGGFVHFSCDSCRKVVGSDTLGPSLLVPASVWLCHFILFTVQSYWGVLPVKRSATVRVVPGDGRVDQRWGGGISGQGLGSAEQTSTLSYPPSWTRMSQTRLLGLEPAI